MCNLPSIMIVVNINSHQNTQAKYTCDKQGPECVGVTIWIIREASM
jgi:hypothetical protein